MVVDQDYRGSIIVALHNDTDEVQTIEANERIAQLVVVPFIPVYLFLSDKLSDTERGDSGFGSTGTN
jgi:dUTP pyrophosphatase